MPSSEAPQPLELVRQFVNSVDLEEGPDEFATSEKLTAWLSAHDLPTPATRLRESDRRRVVEVREALRELLLANNGEPGNTDAAEKLNAIAGDVRLVARFGRDGDVALEPAGRGIDEALGKLIAIVQRSMADGTWQRLKACRADTCQWAFYDRSKNRSGTWCSMEVCGNRQKARAYRSRHQHAKK
jgi:predicted RNA-binding Zn ribbon-like protein